jgi:hypothetical protein
VNCRQMNKRFGLFILLLLVLFGLVWIGVHSYLGRKEYMPPVSEQELLAQHAKAFPGLPSQPPVLEAAPISTAHSVRLAVGGLGAPCEAQNRELADLVTVELAGSKGLELAERQEVDKGLRELELDLSGLVRPKEAVRVRRFLRADWFLLVAGAVVSATNRIVVVRVVAASSAV